MRRISLQDGSSNRVYGDLRDDGIINLQSEDGEQYHGKLSDGGSIEIYDGNGNRIYGKLSGSSIRLTDPNGNGWQGSVT